MAGLLLCLDVALGNQSTGLDSKPAQEDGVTGQAKEVMRGTATPPPLTLLRCFVLNPASDLAREGRDRDWDRNREMAGTLLRRRGAWWDCGAKGQSGREMTVDG